MLLLNFTNLHKEVIKLAKTSKRTCKVIELLKEQRTILDPKCGKQNPDNTDEILVCSRADGNYCSAYAYPSAKWRIGDCPMADSFLRSETEEVTKGKVRVGQQKQKKKARR